MLAALPTLGMIGTGLPSKSRVPRGSENFPYTTEDSLIDAVSRRVVIDAGPRRNLFWPPQDANRQFESAPRGQSADRL